MSLRPWMFLGQISAFELEGTRRLLDKLWESGIREVVLGDLIIDGKPAFSPNRDLYKDVKRQPPEIPSELAPKAKIIADAVKEAKERGFKIYLHDWGAYGGGSCINDPESLKYFLVRTQDAYTNSRESLACLQAGMNRIFSQFARSKEICYNIYESISTAQK